MVHIRVEAQCLSKEVINVNDENIWTQVGPLRNPYFFEIISLYNLNINMIAQSLQSLHLENWNVA